MGYFVTNTTGTMALRKAQISVLEVVQNGAAAFDLNIYLVEGLAHAVVFETDTTLQGIQGIATAILAELDA